MEDLKEIIEKRIKEIEKIGWKRFTPETSDWYSGLAKEAISNPFNNVWFHINAEDGFNTMTNYFLAIQRTKTIERVRIIWNSSFDFGEIEGVKEFNVKSIEDLKQLTDFVILEFDWSKNK